MKFGRKQSSAQADQFHFDDYVEEETQKVQGASLFKPMPAKRKQKKTKKGNNESFYGAEEMWQSQKKSTPQKKNYIKGREISFDAISDDMEPACNQITVVGVRNCLVRDNSGDDETSAPGEITLMKVDIDSIRLVDQYLTSDAVDAGLMLLDRRLNEELSEGVTVYTTQNCRLIAFGELSFVKQGRFIAVLPRQFGFEEEAERYKKLKKGVISAEPGCHYTMVSNLFCEPHQVRVYETFGPFRSPEVILTRGGKSVLKNICLSEDLPLNVQCINVEKQTESECGALSVALAVNLGLSSSENSIFQKVHSVRNMYLRFLKENKIKCFKTHERRVDNQILFSVDI